MAKITREQAEEQFDNYARNVKEDDVSGILDKEEEILRKARGPLEKFAHNIKLLFSIVKDYANGTYRELPWTTIAGIIGTLVYIISPIDLIPDFIPVIGLMDDAAVVAVCLTAIGMDLKKYEAWKSEHSAEFKIINEGL